MELSENEATVKSDVQWDARRWTFPAASSDDIKAVSTHTWKVRRSPESGRAMVALNSSI